MDTCTTIPLGKLFYSNNLLLLGFFPGIQPKRSFSPSLVSLHYSYSNKSLAHESILNEDIFSLNTSITHNQELTKLKMLILTLVFARERNTRISQRKVDFNCNKKYLSPADSQLVWGVLFCFPCLFKFVRFVKSTGLYSLETGAFICCREAVQSNSSIMLSSLTSADCYHLESSHYNCFQQPKGHAHRCYQERFLIIHLLPYYLS